MNNDRQTLLTGGIFARENGQRLLQILVLIGDRALRGLYDKCTNNGDNPNGVKSEYYRTGLQRIRTWPERTFQEDIASVSEICPDFRDTFEAFFADFMHERYRGTKHSVIPETSTFVREFMIGLAMQPALTSGKFFEEDPLITRVACSEAARNVLYGFFSRGADDGGVELQSDVASTVSIRQPPQSSPLREEIREPQAPPEDHPVSPPARRTSRAPSVALSDVSSARAQEEREPALRGSGRSADPRAADRETVVIGPDDSISQVGRRDPIAAQRVTSTRDPHRQEREPREDDLGSVVEQDEDYDAARVAEPAPSRSDVPVPRTGSSNAGRDRPSSALSRPASVVSASSQPSSRRRIPAAAAATNNDASTQLSRHEFDLPPPQESVERPREEAMVPPVPPQRRHSSADARSTVSQSSRVSLGVKRVTSPR